MIHVIAACHFYCGTMSAVRISWDLMMITEPFSCTTMYWLEITTAKIGVIGRKSIEKETKVVL